MRQRIGIVALIALSLFGGAVVVMAQDGTTTTVEGQVTELAVITELTYGDITYSFSEADGTVAVGFVTGRTTTTERSTLDVVLFGHDGIGWRSLGVLTGEATGPLQGAVAGDVLTLSVIGAGDE